MSPADRQAAIEQLAREAVPFIQEEHDTMVRSYSVGQKSSPDYGKVVDRAAEREIKALADWLKRAKRFLE